VEGHPLAEWDALDTFDPPDPAHYGHMGPLDWDARLNWIQTTRRQGGLTYGSIDHGFLFMRLYYLRGFENLMLDIATHDPRLWRLIELMDHFNQYHVVRYLQAGVDVMHFAEDLGTQNQAMLSPAQFEEWLAPSYRRLMQPCREAGMPVAFHVDGYIMDIADNLLNCGITVLNPQDLVNGIDNLERELKGRVCLRLDVDRQRIVPFGTPKEIRALIEEEVRRLGSPEGGLELICGIYPPTPAENVDAVLGAMEDFRTYWWE